MSFRFLRKWKGELPGLTPSAKPVPVVHCEYEASFWEGPEQSGQVGRRRTVRCSDTFIPKSGRFVNTSPSVSYYDQLRKAFA